MSMAKFLPIMLALCSMLLYTHYAQNYAGIIDAGLVLRHSLSTPKCQHMLNTKLIFKVSSKFCTIGDVCM